MRAGRAFLVAAVLAGVLASGGGLAGATTSTPGHVAITGQGSTYAALAFTTWTEKAQNQGLNVNYTATSSPAGLSAYAAGTATFAASEAEFSELYPTTPDYLSRIPRGFAYAPDVGSAVALMYHVALTSAGKVPVTYLHLSPLTVARIFMHIIQTWTSPTISKDNKGLVLPHEPITLDLRSGQSGTTALFYDFVKHADPSQFATWAAANDFPTTSRVWDVVTTPSGFGKGPGFESFSGSDQQAESISAASGLWSIGYDEFGYALQYNDDVAWMENAVRQLGVALRQEHRRRPEVGHAGAGYLGDTGGRL